MSNSSEGNGKVMRLNVSVDTQQRKSLRVDISITELQSCWNHLVWG